MFFGLKCCSSWRYMSSNETWEASPIKERTTNIFRIEDSAFYKPSAVSLNVRTLQKIEMRMFFENET